MYGIILYQSPPAIRYVCCWGSQKHNERQCSMLFMVIGVVMSREGWGGGGGGMGDVEERQEKDTRIEEGKTEDKEMERKSKWRGRLGLSQRTSEWRYHV